MAAIIITEQMAVLKLWLSVRILFISLCFHFQAYLKQNIAFVNQLRLNFCLGRMEENCVPQHEGDGNTQWLVAKISSLVGFFRMKWRMHPFLKRFTDIKVNMFMCLMSLTWSSHKKKHEMFRNSCWNWAYVTNWIDF